MSFFLMVKVDWAHSSTLYKITKRFYSSGVKPAHLELGKNRKTGSFSKEAKRWGLLIDELLITYKDQQVI